MSFQSRVYVRLLSFIFDLGNGILNAQNFQRWDRDTQCTPLHLGTPLVSFSLHRKWLPSGSCRIDRACSKFSNVSCENTACNELACQNHQAQLCYECLKFDPPIDEKDNDIQKRLRTIEEKDKETQKNLKAMELIESSSEKEPDDDFFIKNSSEKTHESENSTTFNPLTLPSVVKDGIDITFYQGSVSSEPFQNARFWQRDVVNSVTDNPLCHIIYVLCP